MKDMVLMQHLLGARSAPRADEGFGVYTASPVGEDVQDLERARSINLETRVTPGHAGPVLRARSTDLEMRSGPDVAGRTQLCDAAS